MDPWWGLKLKVWCRVSPPILPIRTLEGLFFAFSPFEGQPRLLKMNGYIWHRLTGLFPIKKFNLKKLYLAFKSAPKNRFWQKTRVRTEPSLIETWRSDGRRSKLSIFLYFFFYLFLCKSSSRMTIPTKFTDVRPLVLRPRLFSLLGMLFVTVSGCSILSVMSYNLFFFIDFGRFLL
jgi:hypothetical protein